MSDGVSLSLVITMSPARRPNLSISLEVADPAAKSIVSSILSR